MVRRFKAKFAQQNDIAVDVYTQRVVHKVMPELLLFYIFVDKEYTVVCIPQSTFFYRFYNLVLERVASIHSILFLLCVCIVRLPSAVFMC